MIRPGAASWAVPGRFCVPADACQKAPRLFCGFVLVVGVCVVCVSGFALVGVGLVGVLVVPLVGLLGA